MLLEQSVFSIQCLAMAYSAAGQHKCIPRFRTPYLSQIYTGIAVCIATGSCPAGARDVGSTSALLAFVLVCAGVWICGARVPISSGRSGHRLFPLVPLLGILSCLGLMLTLPLDT